MKILKFIFFNFAMTVAGAILWIFLMKSSSVFTFSSHFMVRAVDWFGNLSQFSDAPKSKVVMAIISVCFFGLFATIALIRILFFVARHSLERKKDKEQQETKLAWVVSLILILIFVLAMPLFYRVLKVIDAGSARNESPREKNLYKKIRNPKVARIIWKWEEDHCSSLGGLTFVNEIDRDIQAAEIADYTEDGGNHTLANIKGFVFNIQTGKIYELSDLFMPNTNWPHVVWSYVQDEIKKCELVDLPKEEWASGQYHSFTIDKRNLKFYFDRCLWAPCACGGLEVDVPLNDIRGILNPMFLVKNK